MKILSSQRIQAGYLWSSIVSNRSLCYQVHARLAFSRLDPQGPITPSSPQSTSVRRSRSKSLGHIDQALTLTLEGSPIVGDPIIDS